MSLLDAVAAGPTAQIIVGSGENIGSFHVHKRLLCDSSTYFKAALNNGFAETKEQMITLDDEDPAIFRTLVLWLYDGKLDLETLPPDSVRGRVEHHLFKLYVFADERGIRNLANDTITMLAAYWTEKEINLVEVAWVIVFVSHNSKLYDLILDVSVLELRDASLHTLREGVIKLSKEFLLDLLLRSNELSERFRDHYNCLQSAYHYHCHQGEGFLSEDDCIYNIEASDNTYYNDGGVVQCDWTGES